MLSPKCVLITGAAGGIGNVLVSTFIERGYRVIALDITSQPQNLECWQYLQIDLAKFVSGSSFESDKLASISSLLDSEGLHVLVNNAAIQVLGGVESLSLSDWHRTLYINLLAPFTLTQRFLPVLEKAGGCVINISSIHARLTKANFVAYATSKSALSGMTRAMAVDLGGRVRVNAIEPAAIETEMLKAGFAGNPEKYAELQACHPQGRIGSPSEVAALAVSLASGEVRFLHGACIGMDGGISGRLHDPV